MLRICYLVLTSLLAALCLAGCDGNGAEHYQPTFGDTPPVRQETTYLFGIHPLHNPVRLHETFNPIMEYLTENIPGARFRLEASRNYESFDNKLYARKFEFALPNPYETVLALKHGYRVFGKMANDDEFRGIFLVRRDSNIDRVSDLKGKKVGFPAPTALAATLMPQYYLQTHGLNVMQDIESVYVGSQESSIMNVMLGNVAAGATWLPPWRNLSAERPELARELRIIWTTSSLPSNSLIVRDDVPDDIQQQVARLLLNMHNTPEGRRRLARMEQAHFEPATDTTYQPVQDFLVKFSKTVRPVEH